MKQQKYQTARKMKSGESVVEWQNQTAIKRAQTEGKLSQKNQK